MSNESMPPQGPEEPQSGSVEPTPAPSPAGAGSTPASPAPSPVAYGSPSPTPEAADVEKNKVFAALSYAGILWLVPLLAAKDSPYAKYHCNQGILLSILEFGLAIVLVIASVVAGFVPVIGWCMGCLLDLLLLAFCLTFSIMGVLNAINGRMKPLPLFPRIDWVK